MKKIFLSLLALLSFIVCSAQLKTQSNYDANGDGTVNITDITSTVNKVLGKATDEYTVVDGESLNAWLQRLGEACEAEMELDMSLVERIEAIEDKFRIFDPVHKYVDLGLPSGLKWATCNVGANRSEEFGDYFAWGATVPQEVYDWVHTPYQTQNVTVYADTKYTKYLGSTTSNYKDSNATDADALKTVLDPEDDAAHVNWGDEWRMPTKEEQEELLNNCYWQWVTTYRRKPVNGYIVYKAKDSADKGKCSNDSTSYSPVGSYSVSDPHIFLPAAGYCYHSDVNNTAPYGFYWSSSYNLEYPGNAYYLYFNLGYNSGNAGSNSIYCCEGRPVRAVCP